MISSEFCSILSVFVNFVGFCGFTWNSRLRELVKYQKPCTLEQKHQCKNQNIITLTSCACLMQLLDSNDFRKKCLQTTKEFLYLIRDFIKGRALGKLTGCENNFAHLVWPSIKWKVFFFLTKKFSFNSFANLWKPVTLLVKTFMKPLSLFMESCFLS